MRIYRITDRIPYKIGELEIKISPLSVENKGILTELMVNGQSKQDVKLLMEASMFALQCCVKEINGLKDSEDNEYKLEFDESGRLTKECVGELMNLEMATSLVSFCSAFINGVPNKLPDGITLVEKKTKNQKAQKQA